MKSSELQVKPAQEEPVQNVYQTVKYSIERNDTLSSILQKFEVPKTEEFLIVQALSTVFSPRKIRAGHLLQFNFDASNRLISMIYHASLIDIFKVESIGKKFEAKKILVPVEVKTQKIDVSINYSLYQSLIDAGESPMLISLLVDILAWDVDFMSDPRGGDRISLLVEKKFVNGDFYTYGKVKAVEYDGKLIKQEAFYFEPGEGYYDENGKSLARNFLKSPVKYSRISSGFGRRRHPVTHKLHNHIGTDFVAPVGTPVWAMADGRVTKKSYSKYNGRYIVIKHNNGYSTYYLHLSRYAKGINVGSRVKQKDLIGYVGTTGRSTGPHLHLSVKYNGQYINPLKIKRIKTKALTDSQMPQFKMIVEEYSKNLIKQHTYQ